MANIYEEGQDYLSSLLTSTAPQTTTDKLNNLAKAQQDKVTTLTGAEKVLLRGFNDADTPVDVNDIDYRLQGAQGQSYDAVETRHGDKPIDMYGGTSPYQKSPKAMNAQRTLVAKMVGKPESALTEQDFIDVGNWQTIQAAADVINGPGVWQAPFVQGTVPIDLSGKQGSLDIPATVKTTGKDRYGRNLSTLGTAEGVDVTTPAAYDPQRNAAYKYIQQPVSSNTDIEFATKFADELSRDNTVLGRAWNTTKAVGAGAANSVYDLIDAGAELLGSDLGTDEEKTAQVNQLFGYDPRYSQEASDRIKSKIQNMQKNGVTTGKVLSTLWEGIKTPEFMGESFGYLIPMLIGGPETALGKAVVSASNGVKAAKTAAELTVATEKLNEAKAAYTNTAKALDFVSKQAGLLGTSIGGTNDDLDKYAKNAGISKGDINISKVAGAFAGQVVLNALDKFTDISVLKSPEMVEGLRAVIRGMTNVQLKELGKGMSGIVAGIAVGGGKEAATEYAQEFIQEIGQQVGEQSGKTIADAWNNEDNKLNRLTNAVLGFTGAQQFQGAGVAKTALTEGVGATIKETTGMLNSIADKANAPQVDPIAEQHATGAQVDAEALKAKFNIRTPEDKAKFLKTYDLYALPENSTDESEVRNLATETLKGNDNGNILGADIDDAERARRLKNAVIAADGSIVANRDNVVDMMATKYGLGIDEAASIFDNGIRIRNAIDDLTPTSTKDVKTTEQVEQEATEGKTGFKTYYRNIKVAQANGDAETEHNNLVRLEYFLGTQERKVRIIEATEQLVEDNINKEVDSIVQASQGNINAQQALSQLMMQYSKDKVETADYGTGKFNVSYKQVAEKMLLPKDRQSTFTGGGYKAIRKMQNELAAMNTLHADVTGALDKTTNVQQPVNQPQVNQPQIVEPQVNQPQVNQQQVNQQQIVEPQVAEQPVEPTANVQPHVSGYDKLVARAQIAQQRGDTKQGTLDAIAKSSMSDDQKALAVRAVESVYGPEQQAAEQPADTIAAVKTPTVTEFGDETIETGVAPTEAAPEVTSSESTDIFDPFALMNSPEFEQQMQAFTENLADMIDDVDSVEDTAFNNSDEYGRQVEAMNTAFDFDSLIDEYGFDSAVYYPDLVLNTEASKVANELVDLANKLDSALAADDVEQIAEIDANIEATLDKQTEMTAASRRLIDNIRNVSKITLFNIQGFGDIVKDIFKVRNVTGLTAKELVANDTLKTEINDAVAKMGGISTSKTTGMITADTTKIGLNGKQSPYLALLYKVENKQLVINDNVAIAIDAAINKYLSDNGTLLTTPKTLEELSQIIPGIDVDTVDVFDNVLLTQGGNLTKFVADEVGAHIARYLGIGEGPLASAATYKAFITGLGYVALQVAKQRELVAFETVVNGDIKVPVTTINKKIYFSKAKEIRSRSKELDSKLLYDVDTSRGPMLTPATKDRFVNIHHQPFANASETQAETVRTLEQMPFNLNEGIDVLKELFEKDGKLDTEALMTYVGYDDVSTRTDISKSTRLSKEGANKTYKDAVGTLADAIQRFGKDTKMFFKWFLTKGGRFNLDSTTLNPQTEKHLHRWLVTAEDARTELTRKEMDALVNATDEKLTDKAVAFAYAIGQAFGVKIDKIDQKEVIAEARKLIAMGKNSLVTKVRSDLAKNPTAYEHLGQVAVAIAAIDRYLNTKEGESFTTNLTVEFDGLTSGFAFKVMQYPIGDFRKWLPKIGVLVQGVYDDKESMNGVKGSKTMDDVYETIGKLFKQWNFKDTKRLTNWIIDPYKPRPGQVLTDAEAQLAQEHTEKLLNMGLLPEVKVINGVVDKIVRDLMKNPTMIFNYGAGIRKIVKNVAENLVYDTIDKFLERTINEQGVETYVISDEAIADLLKIDPSMAEGVRANLRVNELTHKSNQALYNIMLSSYKATYGAPVGDALAKTFKEYIELTRAINGAFDAMYQVFIGNVNKVAAELYRDGKLTGYYLNKNQKLDNVHSIDLTALNTRDVVTVVRRMVELGLAPAVQSPDGDRSLEKLVAFSRKTANAKTLNRSQDSGEAFDASIEVNKGTVEGETLAAVVLITNIVGDPKAAGAVLMTHFKDGLSIGETINKYKFLGIHDAQNLGLGQMAATKEYNKNWYELNRRYSDMEALVEMLQNVPNEYLEDETLRVVMEDAQKELDKFAKAVSKGRDELYSLPVRVGQMVGINGSMYQVDPSVWVKEMEAEVYTITDELINPKDWLTYVPARKAFERILDAISKRMLSGIEKADLIYDVLRTGKLGMVKLPGYDPSRAGKQIAAAKRLVQLRTKIANIQDKIDNGVMTRNQYNFDDKPEFAKLPMYVQGQKNMAYAGIGSRRTPKAIQKQMNQVAKMLEQKGYTLRSGGAFGADKAFEGVNQDNGKSYSSLVTNLTERVKPYTHLITTDKKNENVMRKLDDGSYGKFGNPFSEWTVATENEGDLSAMFYDWIVNNNIPATFLEGESNRTERLAGLDASRRTIISNLSKIAGKSLYYEGTAKGRDLSHASVLALIADLVASKKLVLDPTKAQNVLKTRDLDLHAVKAKEIYTAKDATEQTRTIAKEVHPMKDGLKFMSLDLMARNTNQIFGKTLNAPVDFVLAWTPLNSHGQVVTSFAEREISGEYKTGGTGQAIEMASAKNIPVINMADPNWKNKLEVLINNKVENTPVVQQVNTLNDTVDVGISDTDVDVNTYEVTVPNEVTTVDTPDIASILSDETYAYVIAQKDVNWLLSEQGKAERIEDVGASGYKQELADAQSTLKVATDDLNEAAKNIVENAKDLADVKAYVARIIAENTKDC